MTRFAAPAALLAAIAIAGDTNGASIGDADDGAAFWREAGAGSAFEAGSEQRPPVDVCATLYERRILGRRAALATLPASLRESGARAAQAIRTKLGEAAVDFEAWPTQDDEGQRVWAFARWRRAGEDAFRWLDARTSGLGDEPRAIVAATYRPSDDADARAIFADALARDNLYEKPIFGECVWTDATGTPLLAAWLPPRSASIHAPRLTRAGAICHALPQRARCDDRPARFILRTRGAETLFPAAISWAPDGPRAAPPPLDAAPVVRAFPADLEARIRADVLTLDGEREAVFPRSGRRARFRRKSCADAESDLPLVIAYLEERYEALGIARRRQPLRFRGTRHSNLLAILPGAAPDASRCPVILADHVDTAFAEDVFRRTGRRVSVPGADDDATGTAALLCAAEVLRGLRLRRDVWLLHLTCEEFPVDSLGARRFLARLLGDRQDIAGLVVLDMIGWRDPAARDVFQIHAGASPAAIDLARVALGASAYAAPALTPVYRSRFDPRSYLYNTDGLIFSDAGYPVILLNEHLNRLENLDRDGYHTATDTTGLVDFAYAAAIAKVAIETAARLAEDG